MKNLISYRTIKTIHNGDTTVAIGKTFYTTSAFSSIYKKMDEACNAFASLSYDAFTSNRNKTSGVSRPQEGDSYDEKIGFMIAQSKAEAKSLKTEVRELDKTIAKMQSVIDELNELSQRAKDRISDVEAFYAKSSDGSLETKAHLLD